jgi:ribonucleoside-triphosphate reductase (formate)
MVQTKCEIYSRVVGYIRPVEQWHEGKQSEFQDRKKFGMPEKVKEQAQLC